MGHGGEASASQHYAGASAKRKVIVPSADPDQMARVRQVIDLKGFEKPIAEDDRPPTPTVSP
jgi:hypothetical protein